MVNRFNAVYRNIKGYTSLILVEQYIWYINGNIKIISLEFYKVIYSNFIQLLSLYINVRHIYRKQILDKILNHHEEIFKLFLRHFGQYIAMTMNTGSIYKSLISSLNTITCILELWATCFDAGVTQNYTLNICIWGQYCLYFHSFLYI